MWTSPFLGLLQLEKQIRSLWSEVTRLLSKPGDDPQVIQVICQIIGKNNRTITQQSHTSCTWATWQVIDIGHIPSLIKTSDSQRKPKQQEAVRPLLSLLTIHKNGQSIQFQRRWPNGTLLVFKKSDLMGYNVKMSLLPSYFSASLSAVRLWLQLGVKGAPHCHHSENCGPAWTVITLNTQQGKHM